MTRVYTKRTKIKHINELRCKGNNIRTLKAGDRRRGQFQTARVETGSTSSTWGEILLGKVRELP